MIEAKTVHICAAGCDPDKGRGSFKTFTVSIYPLIPKASGKGTKRGKAVVRVHGLSAERQAVFDRAETIATALTEGRYTGKKDVRMDRPEAVAG